MTILGAKCDPLRAVAGIKPPDSRIARAAMELARDVSSPMLFHHVMRSYWFGELLGQGQPDALDREIILLSSVLHDLGLTDHARGARRFEVEGADAARQFVAEQGLAHEKAWMVHDTIMLHTMDHNLYRQPEARMVQGGILADVVGVGLDALDKRGRRVPPPWFQARIHFAAAARGGGEAAHPSVPSLHHDRPPLPGRRAGSRCAPDDRGRPV